MKKQDIVGYRTPLDAARRYKLEKVKVLKVAEDGSVAEVMLKGDARDGSKITLKADQIDLNGKNINLTSDDISISSTNFNVDTDGNLTCSNANISGTINASSGTYRGTLNTSDDCIVGNNLYVGQNQSSTITDIKEINFTDNTRIRRLKYGSDEALSIFSEFININPKYNFSLFGYSGGSSASTNLLSIYSDNSTYRSSLNCNTDQMFFAVQPTIGSDIRLKNKIKETDISWIDDLKLKEFEYKKEKGKKQIGLIAQDYIDKDYSKYFLEKKENGYYGIQYGNINNALIQYCQELKQRVNNLEKRVEELERRK